MQSRVKRRMENLSDIQRDTCSESSGLLVRSMWSQMSKDAKARQKATWTNLPGLWTTHGMSGVVKKGGDWQKENKEKEWIVTYTRATRQQNISDVCLNKTKNECVKKGDVSNDCDGKALRWNERLCTGASRWGNSTWGGPQLQQALWSSQ